MKRQNPNAFMLVAALAAASGFMLTGQQAAPARTDSPAGPDVQAARETRPAQNSAVRTHYVLSEDGTEARYRVREQLARIDFPSDAVGATKAVTGGITVEDDGTIARDESTFTVDVTMLATDSNRRDNYVRRNTLQTAEHPTVTLVPTALRGLTAPMPASGEASFELVGDLTIRGVTRPTTWQVTAQFDGTAIRGTATTSFTFDQFQMTKPRVASVLSVADDIRLEFDFHLVPAAGGER